MQLTVIKVSSHETDFSLRVLGGMDYQKGSKIILIHYLKGVEVKGENHHMQLFLLKNMSFYQKAPYNF